MNSRFLNCSLGWVAAVAALTLFSAGAAAHQQGSSYSQWQLSDGVAESVSVRVSALDLTRVGIHPTVPPSNEIAEYLQQRLQLAGCAPGVAETRLVDVGWYSVSWNWLCDAEVNERKVTSKLFAEVAPNHLHFIRTQNNQSSAIDAVISRHNRTLTLGAESDAKALGMPAYMLLGITHIFKGCDHVAFLLGLMLIALRRKLLWLVTGFTIGHAITLSLAATGKLFPIGSLVESAIAWSIALLAAEILWRKYQARWPWLLPLLLLGIAVTALPTVLLLGFMLFTVGYAIALEVARPVIRHRLTTAVTVAFGLIHGCGFASVLADIGGNGVTATQLPALFGFNLGIEIGQLLIVLLVLPVFWLLKPWRSRVSTVMCFGLLAVSSYWWVLRL